MADSDPFTDKEQDACAGSRMEPPDQPPPPPPPPLLPPFWSTPNPRRHARLLTADFNDLRLSAQENEGGRSLESSPVEEEEPVTAPPTRPLPTPPSTQAPPEVPRLFTSSPLPARHPLSIPPALLLTPSRAPRTYRTYRNELSQHTRPYVQNHPIGPPQSHAMSSTPPLAQHRIDFYAESLKRSPPAYKTVLRGGKEIRLANAVKHKAAGQTAPNKGVTAEIERIARTDRSSREGLSSSSKESPTDTPLVANAVIETEPAERPDRESIQDLSIMSTEVSVSPKPSVRAVSSFAERVAAGAVPGFSFTPNRNREQTLLDNAASFSFRDGGGTSMTFRKAASDSAKKKRPISLSAEEERPVTTYEQTAKLATASEQRAPPSEVQSRWSSDSSPSPTKLRKVMRALSFGKLKSQKSQAALREELHHEFMTSSVPPVPPIPPAFAPQNKNGGPRRTVTAAEAKIAPFSGCGDYRSFSAVDLAGIAMSGQALPMGMPIISRGPLTPRYAVPSSPTRPAGRKRAKSIVFRRDKKDKDKDREENEDEEKTKKRDDDTEKEKEQGNKNEEEEGIEPRNS